VNSDGTSRLHSNDPCGNNTFMDGRYSTTRGVYPSHILASTWRPAQRNDLPLGDLSELPVPTAFNSEENPVQYLAEHNPNSGAQFKHLEETYPNTDKPMQECSYEKQKERFKGAATLPCAHNGRMVPQKMHRPATESEMARSVRNARLCEPIYFWQGSSCGLPLMDILMGRMDNLTEANRVVFTGSSQSILIKLRVMVSLLTQSTSS
jgi:hypothetical protein